VQVKNTKKQVAHPFFLVTDPFFDVADPGVEVADTLFGVADPLFLVSDLLLEVIDLFFEVLAVFYLIGDLFKALADLLKPLVDHFFLVRDFGEEVTRRLFLVRNEFVGLNHRLCGVAEQIRRLALVFLRELCGSTGLGATVALRGCHSRWRRFWSKRNA
jgi:hypothetical protein